MSDIKLFRIANETVSELERRSSTLEKSLQTLIERHLDSFLKIRFLASEYSTGKTHGGRIDTLGIDENGCPVIVEYKRASNENVINQGLFYLDWLLDHKAEFELLVLRTQGKKSSDAIEWSSPRLLCIAGDFTKYDEHAVQQINRNIELIRYKRYADDLLMLELVNAVTAEPMKVAGGKVPKAHDETMTDKLNRASPVVKDLYEALKSFLVSLGDDVQVKPLRNYIAFKRMANFATVIVGQKDWICAWVKLNPDDVKLEEGFTRDVRNVGHHGVGDLEITIQSMEDLEKAKPILEKCYEKN